MGKINTNNYPNRPVSAYQDDDMFILQDNGGETYTTNVGDIKTLIDNKISSSGKADKVSSATAGHLAGLDANGNLTDSGISASNDGTIFAAELVTSNGVTASDISYFNEIDMDGSTIYSVGTLHVDRIDVDNEQAVEFLTGITVNGDVTDEDGNVLSNKTDKVENATSGHLAGLDSNGNLTDSGVSPTEDVAVEGNPVTFDSPFEQDAKSVVVSVKPIQNLHGYDHPWVGGAGKNKVDNSTNIIGLYNGSGTFIDNNEYNSTALIAVKPSTQYTASIFDASGNYINNAVVTLWADANTIISELTSGTFTTTAETQFVRVRNFLAESSYIPNNYNFQLEQGETHTSFAPYSNICPISGINEVEIEVSDGESEPTITTIPLPSTLYDADVDVTNGGGENRYGYIASYNGETLPGAWISDRDVYTGSNSPTIGAEVCYELATPTTISFTPADVELLEGTNVVSTNGEKVAVKYGRSLWQDIDDLKTDTEGKLNKSDVATIEGDTASRPYSVNEFMLRADGFYKVTQPIAQNASITASNTTKTTIGAVLTALLNA